jgi:hypothetical protein
MFDTANNRLSYGELLQPEVGYHLDFAVGLTYSLDLEALLGIPVSLGLLDETDSELMRSPFYILEAIRKSGDNLAIFCNAGSIAMPQKIESVYSLLENSVFEVKLRNKQNFHPKLWIIKYANADGHAYIKVLVLSRNLTFDTSIDMCVAMQGAVTRVKRNRNKPLADMLNFVNRYANTDKHKKIASLAEDILYVKDFDISHPFEDYEFLPLGIGDGYTANETRLFERKHNIFAVSPFVSDDVMSTLADCNGKKVLLTRKASVTREALEQFNKVYVTKELLTDNEFGVKQDIHTKLYFTQTNDGNFLYIGSANATHNAFYKNAEFLLKLKYKPYSIGFDTFQRDFIPEENCPYERIKSAPEPQLSDGVQEAVDRAFKEAIYAVRGATVAANGDKFDICVDSRVLKTTETVKIAPLQRQELLTNLSDNANFGGLLLRELSEFYILWVHGQKRVIKIATKGIPNDRDDAIYKGIINSEPKFLAYVSFMLSEDYAVGALEAEDNMRALTGDDSANAPVYAAIYEKLLKTVHREPSRLRALADVMRRLDSAIIGEDFTKMYEQFKLAARRLKK